MLKDPHRWYGKAGCKYCYTCNLLRSTYLNCTDQERGFYDLNCRNLAAGMKDSANRVDRPAAAERANKQQIELFK